jgi:hypothetical protein
MSGLPATFPCPWCGMNYPAKPVLVGKAVRCKGCRNAFVLQPEGHAIKVEDPPVAPAPTAAPPPPPAPPPVRPVAPPPGPRPPPVAVIEPISVAEPAPRPPPVPVPRPRPSAAVASPGDDVLDLDAPSAADVVEVLPQAKTQTPPPNKPSERVAKRKTEHLEAARAQMAAQLAEVAEKAANTEVAKREEKKSQRIAKAGGTAVPSSAKPSRKAILSGEGERHHRETVRLWSGIGVAAAVILLLLFVFSLRSNVREGLDYYASPVPNEQNRYPVLGDALRSRAWLASAPSMPGGPMLATDLSDASLAAERPIALETLKPVFADLKDLRLDAALDIWVAPKDLDRARAAVGERRGADALQALAVARIRHVPHGKVVERMGLTPEDLTLVLDLLAGTPPQSSEPFAKRMLDLGEVPHRLVLRNFTGRKGSLLQDIGRPPYRPVQAAYTGVLMRIEGDQWPIGWRVLYLNQVK